MVTKGGTRTKKKPCGRYRRRRATSYYVEPRQPLSRRLKGPGLEAEEAILNRTGGVGAEWRRAVGCKDFGTGTLQPPCS